ncbi:class II fructose-bisphosphate aldolase [Candidatus Bipolaricaulota bacterium]|nr:class II fructose-bisphosphate aldolase [Candidatus Bipolaricaulota bacterium]
MPFRDGHQLREAYRRAQSAGYAFMANNVAEANILLGLLRAYTDARSDLVVQISPGAAKFAGGGDKKAGLRALCKLIHETAQAFPVSVFINLDHFTTNEMDLIEHSIEDRLVSSIMIDASTEAFEENVRISCGVVEMAAGSGILIEAELGKIKGVEDEVASDEALYTHPDEAAEFIRRTGADLLAISIGTQHGVSKGRNIELRVDLAEAIRAKLVESDLDAPLVLHGSSGLLSDQVKDVIGHGVCKLNKDTHYQYVYGRAACQFYIDNAAAVLPPEGVEDDVLNLFSGSEWTPDKSVFDPRVVGRRIQEQVAVIASELIGQSGSAGSAQGA